MIAEFTNLNRLTRHETELYDSAQGDTQLTQRDHGYNATGELTQSGYRKYWESDTPPGFAELEHVYSNGKLLQNTNAEGDGEVRRSTPLGEAKRCFPVTRSWLRGIGDRMRSALPA